MVCALYVDFMYILCAFHGQFKLCVFYVARRTKCTPLTVQCTLYIGIYIHWYIHTLVYTYIGIYIHWYIHLYMYLRVISRQI